MPPAHPVPCAWEPSTGAGSRASCAGPPARTRNRSDLTRDPSSTSRTATSSSTVSRWCTGYDVKKRRRSCRATWNAAGPSTTPELWSRRVSAIRPNTLAEAVEVRAGRPELHPIAGGTDLMVDVNFGRTELAGVLDLTAVAELQGIDRDDRCIRIGAAHPMADIADRLADLAALAGAVVTVGSPQIRARATLGGNLATASPAGDSLPALLVHDAEVEVAGPSGARRMPVSELLLAPR